MTATRDRFADSTLGAVCSLVTDGTHDTPRRVEAGYPLIKAKEIVGGSIDFETCDQISEADHLRVIARSKPERGDTLFAHIGASLGEAALVKTSCEFSIKNIALFKPDPKIINGSYLYYVVKSPYFQDMIKAARTGSAQPFLGLGQLRGHPIRFHRDLREQERISSILAAYDDLIDVNRRRIAVLEEMARRLFEEFVVTAVDRLPDPAGSREHSRLPEGWHIETLGSVAWIVMGQSPPSVELNNVREGLVFHQGVTDFGTLFPGRRVFCNHLEGKRVCEVADILFSVRAPVGRINVATERTVLGRGLSAIRSKVGHPAYLLAHLRSTFHKIDLMGNGAIYKSVNRRDIEQVPIVLPPLEVTTKLEKPLSDLLAQTLTLYRTIGLLANSRDLVLPRLVSGELSVNAAERDQEAAA